MHNKLLQNIALKTVNFSYLTVFKGGEFRKVSQEIALSHWLGLRSLQDLSRDGGSASEFIDMVVGSSRLAVGQRLSSLPLWPVLRLPMYSQVTAAGFLQRQ